MRRLVKTSLTFGLALGLGAGCVEDDGSVFIQGALPLNRADECKVNAAVDEFVFSGTLDVLTPHSFQAALKVVTNLPSTFSNVDVTSGDQKSPNYPDYGATDNNVIIFESAEIDYAFTVPAADVGDVPDTFVCDDAGNCETNTPTVVAVSGTVFNKQTTLSSASAVLVEAISQTVADQLNEAFEGFLTDPSQRVRVIATTRLTGRTTGNGQLRDLTSFPFPFPIEVCRGCLTPNTAFCQTLAADAVALDVANETCFVGQDVPLAVCGCPGAAGAEPTPVGGAGCT